MISIVIVTMGLDEIMAECIDSITRHTRREHEIIVVNNAAKPIQPRADITTIENGRNLGFAKAVNRGIEAAKGDYILLLNNDARLENDAIDRMADFMEEQPAAGICGVQLIYDDGRLQNSIDIIPTLASQFLNKSLLKILFPKRYPSKRSGYTAPVQVPSVIGACMLIRRGVIEIIGGLDEGYFFYLEETDFCKRTVEHGWQIWHLPQINVVHHQGLSAKRIDVRRKVEFHRSLYRFFRKNKGQGYAACYFLLTLLKLSFETLGNLLLIFLPRMRNKLKKSGTLLLWHLLGMPQGWGIERSRPEYAIFSEAGYTWFLPIGQQLPEALRQPNQFMNSFSLNVLNDSRTTYVKSGQLNGEEIFFKRYNFKGPKDCLKNIFRQSRAQHCLEAALMLQELGISTPEVVLACEERKHRILKESFIATRKVEALNLVEYVAKHGCSDELLLRSARLIRKLHDMGVLHVDLKGENLMYDGQTLYLIDLDRLRREKFLTAGQRAKNLSYLNASFVETIPAEKRQLFLHEYIKGHSQLEEISEQFAADIRNLTETRRIKRY